MRWIVWVAAGCAEVLEASDSGGTSPLDDDFPEPWASYEDEVVKLVNQHRFVGGDCGGQSMPSSSPLDMDAVLRGVARAHSEAMAVQGFFDHTDPQGRTPEDRVRDAGFDGALPIGENIAAGYPTPQAVVDGWLDSPGHCLNLLEPAYGVIGVGYFFAEGDALGHYWTQNFAGSH